MEKENEIIKSAVKYIANIHYKSNLMDVKDNYVNQIYSKFATDDDMVSKRIEVIKRTGIKEDIIIELLKTMPILLFIPESEIYKRLSFIYNGEELYAVIYCNDNYYEWTVFDSQNAKFESLQSSEFFPKTISNKENYIIRKILDSTTRNDIKSIANISRNDNLEKKVYKLKQLKINETGYHII